MEITVEAPKGGVFTRELHRLAPETYEPETRMPDFETEYGIPDPKRYVLMFTGYSDVFEDTGFDGVSTVEKVVVEFEIVNSKKWQGVRFSQALTVPKDWTDERGTFNRLLSALQGRPLVKGDKINLDAMRGKQFEGEVANQVSAKGRDYAKITTYLALPDDDDDVIPARGSKPAADDDFPTE